MKKLIAILLLSAAFVAPVKAADSTDAQYVQVFIQCAAVMQITADKAKDDVKLSADVQASADRFKHAAGYFLRGQMDDNQIQSYVEGGVGASRATMEAEFTAGGGAAVEKRLQECNDPQVMAKGFEAYQALGSASAATPAPVTSNPIDIKMAPPVTASQMEQAQ